MKNLLLRVSAILIFSIGMLSGLALVYAATWADVESVFYGFYRFGNKTTSSMQCPILINGDETGFIKLNFRNKTDQYIRPTVRFQASSRTTFRDEKILLSLDPGQSETVQWEVTRRDVALDHFIFAKIFTFASYPQPDIEQTCGILVLDLPGLKGKQIVLADILLSAIGMLGGCMLWFRTQKTSQDRHLDALRAMITLTVTTWLGILSVMLAWWPVGILLSALSLLLVGVIIGHFVQFGKN